MQYTRISAAQAKEALQGFDEWLAATMERWQVLATAVAVVADGEVIYSAGHGYRDVAQQLPADSGTLFAIGSCSKAFTSFGVGLLVEEGRLNWDRPVQQDIPFFRLQDPVASAYATPRDLLTHRVGMGRHDLAWFGTPRDRQALMDALPNLAPSQGFRFGFQYNNLMYMAAGYLAGHVSGLGWEAFTRQRILEQLGMRDTQFSVRDSEKAANAALPYMRVRGEMRVVPFRELDAVGPAGSINSNLNDMSRWLLMHLNKGQHQGRALIRPDLLKAMHTPQIASPFPAETIWGEYPEGEHGSYGLGWALQTYRGRTMVRHYGGIDGFISAVSFMPHQGIGVIILTNTGDDAPAQVIHQHLYDCLLGLEQLPWSDRFAGLQAKAKAAAEKAKAEAASKRVAGTQPSHPLADYAGIYDNAGYGKLEIQYGGDGLNAAYNGLEMDVQHVHYDVFEARIDDLDFAAPVTFTVGMNGAVQAAAIPLEPTTEPIRFVRQGS